MVASPGGRARETKARSAYKSFFARRCTVEDALRDVNMATSTAAVRKGDRDLYDDFRPPR